MRRRAKRPDPYWPAPAPTPRPPVPSLEVVRDFTYRGVLFRQGTRLSPSGEALALFARYPHFMKPAS